MDISLFAGAVLDDTEEFRRLFSGLKFVARAMAHSLFYRPRALFALLSRLWANPDYLLNKPKLEKMNGKMLPMQWNAG
ncbi:MAG: hypothetical protein JSV36_10710 [Anaerolineae bacterium]|nr:MAG: hypothetical protein JSV36_10710 [Anaerolineae bacterium]